MRFSQSCPPAVFASAILCAIHWLSLVGCSGSPGSPPNSLRVPEVEPELADAANASAVDVFRSLEANQTNQLSDQAKRWPQLFGADRSSVAPDQPVDLAWGDTGPDLLWSIEIGTGYGSPVVVADRVVFNHRIDDEEIVQCVSASDGSEIWQHRYPTTFKCDVEYSDGPYSTPVINEPYVYCVGGQGQMFCLLLATGEVVWQRDLHEEYGVEDGTFPVGSTPLLVGDRLIFDLGAIEQEAGIIGLDPMTGETIWQVTDHPAGYCSPFAATIHGQPFAFVYNNLGLISLHPVTGKTDWMIEHYGRAPMSCNAVSPLVVGDKVLIVTGPGPGAVCVQVNPDRSYQELWRDRRVIDCQYNTLIAHDEDVIGFTAMGQGGAELRCVDLRTGDLRWRYHSVLRRGQGLKVNGALILLGEKGHLAALMPEPDGPQVLGFTDQPLMSDPCYCAPAIASSRLYLKDEQRLACFDLSIHP